MTNKHLVIGICGFKGSGKDTVADFLIRNHNCLKDSYAAPLKDAISSIFGWSRNMLEGDTPESRAWREEVDEYWSNVLDRPGFTPRLALQLGGTEAGRNVFGEGLWTGAMSKRVSDRTGAGLGTVVSDVRFPNEIQHVQDMGGVVVQVSRGTNPNFYDMAAMYNYQSRDYLNIPLPDILNTEKGGIHPSEWSWIGRPGITYQLDNNGTLVDLENKINEMVASL